MSHLICPEGHKILSSWHNFFSKGRRCCFCSNAGIDLSAPTILYYLKLNCDRAIYYKIGITNRTVQERIWGIPYPAEIIWQKQYLFGKYAYEDEQAILKKYDRFRYKGNEIQFAGYTELFTKDVLKKDA